MDDLNSGAAGAGEADDLRSQIIAAMSEGADAGADAAPPAEAPVEAPTGEGDPKGDRARDASGRFAKQGEPVEGQPAVEAAPKPGEAAAPALEAEATTPAAPEAPIANRPPNGWSPAAKAAFEALPQEVKDAVAKREVEVNRGLEKLVDFKGLDQFADMAKRSGTTVAKAVEAYRAAEVRLEQDFVGGVAHFCQHYGKHPVEVAAGLLRVDPRALVAALRGPAPQGEGQPSPQPQPAPQGAIDPRLAHQIATLSNAVNGLVGERAAHQRATAASTVEGLFNDPAFPYAHNLEAEITLLINREPAAFQANPREAFASAYEQARFMNHETRALALKSERDAALAAHAATAAGTVKRQSDAAAAARSSARSLTGSPANGVSVAAEPAATLRDEIRRSMNAASRV